MLVRHRERRHWRRGIGSLSGTASARVAARKAAWSVRAGSRSSLTTSYADPSRSAITAW